MAVPLNLLNKPGKLTDDEFVSMRAHPEAGHRMLLQAGGISDVALDVCLHHHEKMDGTGYPYGLAGEQISVYARMGAICDVYDAITSNRPYKVGWCPAESLKKMASWTDSHFDPVLFQAFVKAIGIYPVGSLVRLKSNRLAVIIDQNDKSLLKPVVRAFFSCTSISYIAPEVIDLQASGETDSILSLESATSWGLMNTDRFWT
jgi:HD-GYP domain-containing protein (c-di-GMP phosphodiesterase class II)